MNRSVAVGVRVRIRIGTTAILAALLGFAVAGLSISCAAQESKPPGAPAGNAENGKLLFTKDGCYQCHGREGQGSTMSGPRIAPNPIPFDALSTYIRRPRGEMPPYSEKVLSDRDVADIYAFLQSRKPAATDKSAPLLK